MFKNYFLTSWRNILKEKGYSGFNILGLAIGMAVTLITVSVQAVRAALANPVQSLRSE